MLDPGTIKLFAAIVLFSSATFAVTAMLVGRVVARRPVTRGIAGIVGVAVGLALGVGFLLAMG